MTQENQIGARKDQIAAQIDQIASQIDMSRVVYIKEVLAKDLPKPLAEALPQDIKMPLFAIYAADGTPLSLAQNREMANSAARENNLEPLSVH